MNAKFENHRMRKFSLSETSFWDSDEGLEQIMGGVVSLNTECKLLSDVFVLLPLLREIL